MRRLRRHLFDGEDIVWSTRQHPIVLLGQAVPVVMITSLAVTAFAMVGDSRESSTLVVGAAGVVIAFFGLRFLARLLAWRAHRYFVTSHRLIQSSGCFRRRVSSVPLANVSSVRIRRSFAGKLLGYGELSLSAAGKSQRISHLSQPARTQRAVMEAPRRSLPPDDPAIRSSKAQYWLPPGGDLSGPSTRTAHDPSFDERRAPTLPDTPGHPVEVVTSALRDRPVDEGHVFGGRYVLVSRLAAGGMGTVYEGLDGRLGRLVAIKLLREELAGDQCFVERFRREARSVAALSHPNIAPVFDYGEERSASYIVMELVRGRDLAKVLEREAPLVAGRAVDIARQVLEALEHAHQAGVVHRDIKPANIVVNERDRVKVTDFGIARAAGVSRLTATGILLGSAHYASPEQVGGRPVGPQSDIYSAGILLYEMLVGVPPFEGESLVQVAERHVTEDVPPPSLRNPALQPLFDHVIARATAREPGDRFARAQEMTEALARWEHTRDDLARRPYAGHLTTHTPGPHERIDTPPLGELR
ncbi:hypothetical protein BH18ACT15_BH18ACT15_12870 [soil metagenome]